MALIQWYGPFVFSGWHGPWDDISRIIEPPIPPIEPPIEPLDAFVQLVTGTLRPIRQVRSFTITEYTVQVLFDFGASNSFAEAQLDRAACMWRKYYPNAAMAVLPYNESYAVRFPFSEVEHRLQGRAMLRPGLTRLSELRRLTDALDKTE